MAQGFNETDNPDDAERARLQQEEMARQLMSSPASQGSPSAPSKPSDFPYTPPAAGQDLANGFGEKHASAMGALSGAASGASTGATIGSVVPGLGTLIGGGVGALAGAVGGFLKGRTNDTKNEREQFAQSMGVPDTNALWSKLGETLPADQANELRDRALNRIGKHDTTADQQWMQDVATALQNAPAKGAAAAAPAAGATPGATPATAGGAAAASVASPAPGTAKTNLMEGDPAKLADPAHAAGSPKYDFLQLAQQNKYDYTQMPQMLDELKAGPNARLWQGWQADGKGNFVFGGDPSQLAPEWNGVKRVDAVGAFGNIANGGKAAGWRWGVDDPNGGGAAQGRAPMGAGGGDEPANPSLVPTDTNFYNTLQARLAQILGGPQAFDREALLSQITGK